ncbi:FmdB family zinc ribbon protein [Candidatus Mycalebacterium sp.]
MPCYEYECSKCGDTFEFLHLDNNDVVKCERCGTKKVKRLLSSFGFGFKGFGTSPASPTDPTRSETVGSEATGSEATGSEATGSEGGNETASGGGCGCSSGACGCG